MTQPLRFAVIGSPVAHSKSPAMHQAAYRALGLPHTYERLETSDAEVAERVAALRRGTFAGLNVTVPHKARVLGLVDDVDATAQAVGAANTLRVSGGRVVAQNTDCLALVVELRDLFRGAELQRRSGVVLGSGGAARAAVFALGLLGMDFVEVRARAKDRAAVERALGAVLASARPSASLAVTPLVAPPEERSDLGAIVQATSAGMQGAAPGDEVAAAIAWASVPADAVALDAVYAPPLTPFLRSAGAHGLAHENGYGMLVRQGALAFALWLGQEPPLPVMRAALG